MGNEFGLKHTDRDREFATLEEIKRSIHGGRLCDVGGAVVSARPGLLRARRT
jgi:hypothetical protein